MINKTKGRNKMLQLHNIKKTYKTGEFEQQALKGVSLNFRENEFVAILGPSGGGKTTLLNIIGGLDRYDSGDLIINGKSTKEFKDRDWDAYRNNSIGFIFQSYNLISHITVLDNVEMCMTLSGVSASEKKKRALEVLDRVGLKEHAHKKPNQLSGGQMQRVAIARALVNNPDIILADEPTGALDTVTSVQIMELIKEIAKDKLVIMVTHNPDLAEKYASRIVKFRDGNIESDSNPVSVKELKQEYHLKKTSMSFFTALKLSFTNIKTKKGRTLLTAFASSIGIIGIAIILSLSNGFDKQIDKFEANTLSSFPILITQQAMQMDMEEMMEIHNEMLGKGEKEKQYPDVQVVYPYDSNEKTMLHTNILDEKYISYIENIDPNLLMGISYIRMTGINLLKKVGEEVKPIKTSAIHFTSLPKELSEKQEGDFLERGYDFLAGTKPSTMNEIVIEVDNKNRIEKSLLETLGIDVNKEEIDFDSLLGVELKVVLNNEYYQKVGSMYIVNMNFAEVYEKEENITLKVVGIVRAKEDSKLFAMTSMVSSSMNSTNGMATTTVGNILYSNDLIEEIIQRNQDSDLVKDQKEANYNLLRGEIFEKDSDKDTVLNYLGAKDIPAMIQLYPNDFSDKEEILKYLDQYNEGKEKEEQIIYTDMAKEVSSMSASIMDAITIVLVAFSAISLIVSTIMIAIITYISVLERTKEIGILRALGARKKDVTRVFNAETFIVGICSGMLGILIAWSLLPIVNHVLYSLTELENIAVLNPIHAIVLITISVFLTLLGGFIPAKMAAKKDPVNALRTE